MREISRNEKMDHLIRETGNRLVRIESKQNEILKSFASKNDLISFRNWISILVLGALFLLPLLSIFIRKLASW